MEIVVRRLLRMLVGVLFFLVCCFLIFDVKLLFSLVMLLLENGGEVVLRLELLLGLEFI